MSTTSNSTFLKKKKESQNFTDIILSVLKVHFKDYPSLCYSVGLSDISRTILVCVILLGHQTFQGLS